jgi:hypothetical protein
MGMNLWGENPLSENSTLTMLAIITTGRRQRQDREGLSEGSRSAKRRANEQKSDTRLSSRVELAHDNEGREFALNRKSGGCVVTVHALIWGDLFNKRCGAMGAAKSRASKEQGQVQHSKQRAQSKEQGQVQQSMLVLNKCMNVGPDPARSARLLHRAG